MVPTWWSPKPDLSFRCADIDEHPGDFRNYTRTFEATSSGSRLSHCQRLTEITEDTVSYVSPDDAGAGDCRRDDVEAANKLATITGGPVHLESDGSGSTLNVNLLASIQGDSGQRYAAALQATQRTDGRRRDSDHAQASESDTGWHGRRFAQPRSQRFPVVTLQSAAARSHAERIDGRRRFRASWSAAALA